MIQEKVHRRVMKKMKPNHQPNVYLATKDDHANHWGSINLDRKGNMPQYSIKCVISRKKLNDIKSSIIKCVTLIIHVHIRIMLTDPIGVSWKEE